DIELRCRAEALPGVAVRLVPAPELPGPLPQAVGGEDPVLVLDGLPQLEGEARHGHRPCVPVPARLRPPGCPGAVVRAPEGLEAAADLLPLALIAAYPLPAPPGELGQGKGGVAEDRQVDLGELAVLGRPARYAQVGEAHFYYPAPGGDDRGVELRVVITG